MNPLKMGISKTDNHVSPPIAGDGGEAVSGSEKNSVSEPQDNKQTAPRNNKQIDAQDNKRIDAQDDKHTEPQMPEDAGWYVAVVRCNCENTIGTAINDYFRRKKTWFEYWVPMQKVVVIDKRSNKRRTKEKVLLTTFIFCHVSPDHLDTIRFRPDVYKMLTMPGQRAIYRIHDKELNDYRRLVENPDLPVTPCSGPLRKGQKVRITEGKMAGLEAYVQRISGKKATIGNEIKYISGATIEIDRRFLEAITEE